MMPKYTISCNVESASGWQQWVVEASSEEEALRLHADGKSEFSCEEVEVESLGEPEIIAVE